MPVPRPIGGFLAVLTAVAVVAGCSSSSVTTTKLAFKTEETSFTAVPVSGQQEATPQPGDYVVITDDFRSGGKKVGGDFVHCTLITTEASLCSIGVELQGGELTLEGVGPAGGSGSFDVAITGGTGKYEKARGQVHFASTGAKTGEETFTIVT